MLLLRLVERPLPRYHFHITDGNRFYRDDEGVILRDPDAARTYALEDVRDLKRKHPGFTDDWSKWRFEISDSAGQVVLTVPFSDAEGPPPERTSS